MLSVLVKPKFHYGDFATKSQTHIMKVHDTNHVTDFHDLCRQPRILLSTFPVHCNGLNSVRATKRVCHGLVTYFVANISTRQDGLSPRLS